MEIKVIGIGGVARAGKDTLCKYFIDTYPDLFVRFALADELKADLNPFLKSKLGISAFTIDNNEKTLIRDILVAYGKVKRMQTQGRHWTGILQPKIEQTIKEGRIPIVTDIRYDIFPEDELYWLQQLNKGTFIHITRIDSLGGIVPPANTDEALNDPKLKSKANYSVSWPSLNCISDMTVFLNTHIPDVLSHIKERHERV